MPTSKWTVADIPDQSGRIALVTGASSGLGLETARALSQRGATVVLGCLSLELAEQTRQSLSSTARGPLEALELDLEDLNCVARATESMKAKHGKLDLLINNAGVMGLPRQETRDGFESHFGINYLGHFALTSGLLPLLKDRPGARVVTVTSIQQHLGRINFKDLQSERRYNRWKAYAQSKLANTLFTLELQKKLENEGCHAISVAAHPGFSRTNIQFASVKASGNKLEGVVVRLTRPFFQSAAAGARCQLYAATAPGVKGGELYAPHVLEALGWPKKGRLPNAAYDHAHRKRSWEVTEQLIRERHPEAAKVFQTA